MNHPAPAPENAIDSGLDHFTPTESFAALFEESLAHQEMRENQVITAQVVNIDPNFVTVNAGLKSEAFIPRKEFVNNADEFTVQIGDMVSVFVEKIEDGFGHTKLSREKARRIEAWIELEEAQKTGKIVSGVISGRVKGGLTVIVNNLRAFLPGSLVDIRPVKDTSVLDGREVDLKVIKLDHKRNNIVVSRRAVLETNLGEDRRKLLENLQEDAIVKGVVKNITDYGAFIDLGGIDGLVHITDISWNRVKHPSDVLTVGEEVEAKVLRFDPERNRVSLGLKQLREDPWVGLARRYPKGTRLFGKITNIRDYGIFVEVEHGIEGLVHVSEMDWANKNIHPSKVVQIGDETEIMILDIDEDKRRISLGMKQCKDNPWEEFEKTHKKGDKVFGAIKSITDFGIFVGLDNGIDGLIHLSDLPPKSSNEETIRHYKKGEEIETIVLSINIEKEQINLGVKQLEDDSFNQFVARHDKGSIVSGTIQSFDSKGAAIILLADNVQGYLRADELPKGKEPQEGDMIESMVVNIDRKHRVIQLSMKAKENAATQLAKTPLPRPVNTTKLGALLKEKLSESSEP